VTRGKVRIKGADVLDKKLRRLPEVVEAAAKKATKDETHETAQDLRRLAPVLSGDLRKSIQEEIAKKGMVGRAAITADYAKFVIHGTSDTPANDFMTPVEASVRRRFPDRLRDAVRAKLKGL